jgi:MFS family permease
MGLAIFSLWTFAFLGSISAFLFIVLFTLGELCFIPMVSLLVNDLKPDREISIGTSFGVASLAFGVGQGLSNLMGGFFIEFCQKHGLFLFPLLLGILSFCIALLYLNYSNKLMGDRGKY